MTAFWMALRWEMRARRMDELSEEREATTALQLAWLVKHLGQLWVK